MDRTNSMGLWTFAKEFYDAADMISLKRDGISVVAYYLICHSLELVLKAYLRGKGYSLEKLKKSMGHDLEAILDACKKEGIEILVAIPTEYSDVISMIRLDYRNKEFEYIVTGARTYPQIDILLRVAKTLLDHTRQFCFEQRRVHER